MKKQYLLRKTIKTLKRNGFRKDLVFTNEIKCCLNCQFLKDKPYINYCSVYEIIIDNKYHSICNIYE